MNIINLIIASLWVVTNHSIFRILSTGQGAGVEVGDPKCVQVDDTSSSKDNVKVAKCDWPPTSYQKWRRTEADSNGYYQIISLHNNQCMRANWGENDRFSGENSFVNAGDAVHTADCEERIQDGLDDTDYGDPTQLRRWKFTDDRLIKNEAALYNTARKADYYSRAGHPPCLDTGDHNNNVHIWDCNSNNKNQDFLLLHEFANFRLLPKPTSNDGECLEINEDDNSIQLKPCDFNKLSQSWIRGPIDSDGYYALISEHDDKCLDIYNPTEGGDGIGDGAIIQSHACHYGDNQLWKTDKPLIYSKILGTGNNWCITANVVTKNVVIKEECGIANFGQQFEWPGFSVLIKDGDGFKVYPIDSIED